MRFDCFLSYASEDMQFAEDLYQRLTAEDFKVWFDKARLNPGCDWHREIEEGCENSRVVLALLTPNWKLSEWTRYETYGAEAVIPIIVKGNWEEVSTPPLQRYQAQQLGSLDHRNWARLTDALKRARVSAIPEKQSRLRHLVNPDFVGREADLLRIHEDLYTATQAALSRGKVRAIVAMPGTGKTTLVREYAEKFWRCYSQMLWVEATAGLESEFAKLHDWFFPERSDIGLRIEDKAKRALYELHSEDSRLLIIDNAEDEESVSSWIPITGGCHTLITSRFAGFQAIPTIRLSVLDKKSAIEFMVRRSGMQAEGEEQKGCAELVEETGNLPLALEQAAAYMRQQRLGFRAYLSIYRRAKGHLLGRRVLGSTRYPDSVIASLHASLRHVGEGARSILKIISFLANAPMLLRMFAARTDLLGNGAPIDPIEAELWVRDEVGRLADYSLVTIEGDLMRLHPLLQTIEFLLQSEKEQQQNWALAAGALATVTPSAHWKDDCREHWTQTGDRAWRELLPHVEKLLALKKQLGTTPFVPEFEIFTVNSIATQSTDERAIDVCREACTSFATHAPSSLLALEARESLAYLLRMTQKNGEALAEFRELHDILRSLHGENDPRTLRALHNVGLVLQQSEKRAEAEAIFRDVLERRKKVLGEDCYDTNESIHDLGRLLSEDETRDREGEKLLIQAHAWNHRFLDPASPDTRAAATNLASLYRRRGDFVHAEKMQRELLEATRRHLGEDHLECFEVMHNLGLFLANAGRYQEALDAFTKVINGYRRFLPPNHRDMLTAVQDVGTVLGQTGRVKESEQLLREALDGYRKTQEAGSEDRLRTLGNLAMLFELRSEWKQAEVFYREIIAEREQKHGRDHQAPLESWTILGCFQFRIGNRKDAQATFEDVLQRQTSVLGATHKDTLTTLGNLAETAQSMGNATVAEELYRKLNQLKRQSVPLDDVTRLDAVDLLTTFLLNHERGTEAEQLFKQELDERKREMGAEHTTTLECMNRMASHLVKAKVYDEAEALYRLALGGYRTIGEGTKALVVGDNLASMLMQKRNFASAEELFYQGLEARERIFGEDAKETLQAVRNVAHALESQGRAREAAPLRLRTLETMTRLKGAESADVLRELNNNGFAFRKAGLLVEAKEMDRRSAEVTLQVFGARHPLSLHRRNNLAMTLAMSGQLDEASAILLENLNTDAEQYENLTPRFWLLLYLADRLSHKDGIEWLSRLKKHLERPPLRTIQSIQIPWETEYFFDNLRGKCPDATLDLASTLVAALNERCAATFPEKSEAVARLVGFKAWQNLTVHDTSRGATNGM